MAPLKNLVGFLKVPGEFFISLYISMPYEKHRKLNLIYTLHRSMRALKPPAAEYPAVFAQEYIDSALRKTANSVLGVLYSIFSLNTRDAPVVITFQTAKKNIIG